MHILKKWLDIWFLVPFFPIVSNQLTKHQKVPDTRRVNIDSSNKLVTQSFQREPEYLEINPGANALMECTVFGKSHSSLCIWQKDEKPIRMQQDGKYEWFGGQEHGDCSLKIFKADIDYDDGKIL